MPDLLVKKTYPYRGKRYLPGDIHTDAPQKFCRLITHVGKAEYYFGQFDEDVGSESDDGEADVLVSDAVKEFAESEGVDLSEVQGTGKNGRINKSDVQGYKTRMMTAENSRNVDGSEYKSTCVEPSGEIQEASNEE